MKILQIFPGKVWGGAEQYVLDLGTALASEGHEVEYVARPSEALTARLSGNIPFTSVPMGGLFDHQSPKLLSRLLKDVDIVHVHELKQVGIVRKAARLAKVNPKIVVTRHIARESRTMPWHVNAIKGVHRIIFVSDLAKELWTKANRWMPENKCVVIHNSIPDGHETPADNLRRKYEIGNDTALLMFTGRIRKSKGCQTILEALGSVKDIPWKMVFVGTCKPHDYDQTLLKTASAHGISDRIIFHGFSNNVRALVRESDIGLAPSIVREACPLSPMEFMQAGKPVIVTDNGAQPEYVTDGETGVIIHPDSPLQMAEALRKLLSDKKARTSIGKNAEKYFASNLSYPAFIKRIQSAYSD